MINAEGMLSEIYRVLEDRGFQEGLRRAVRASEASLERIFSTHPEVRDLAEKVREARRRVLENLE